MGYLSIGKKRDLPSFLYSGIALMVFPYFIQDLMPNILIGVALSLTPFFLSRSFNSS